MCQSDAHANSSMMMGNAAIGAFGQYQTGKINAQNAMTKANFEKAQMDAMGVLADARKYEGEADIRSAMASQIQNNIAAAMFSGLDMASFDSIDKGMKKDTRKALSRLSANTEVEKLNYRNQGAMAMLGGQMDAAAARLDGNLSAVNTLVQGAETYADTKYGKSFNDPSAQRKKWRKEKIANAKESWGNAKSFFQGWYS